MALGSHIRKLMEEEPRPQGPQALSDKEIATAGKTLAASLTWLPTTASGEFAARCEALVSAFKSLRPRVDAAFAKASS